MKVNISGFYDEVTTNFVSQVQLVKKLGEGYLCPRNVDGKNISAYTALEFEKAVKPVCDEYGVKFSSIGSPMGKIDLYDDEAYLKQCAQLKELVKIANLMDCKYIRIFSFHVDPKGDYDKYFPDVVKKLAGFIEIAKAGDVILLHENEKKIYGDVPDRCLKIYEALKCDNFKLIYDASNFIQCKADPWEAYLLLKDFVVYYHIKDCSKESVEMPLGLGEGRYDEIIKDLAKRDYEGFMTMEPHTAKYALLKNAFNVLAPITKLIKPISGWHRAFRRIDKAKGIKMFGKVTREGVFKWQHDALKQMIKDANNEVQEG